VYLLSAKSMTILPMSTTKFCAKLTNKKKDIKLVNKRANDLQKKNKKDYNNIDKLKQYDRRQNLEFHGVPRLENENVTQIVLDLVRKLDVNINEDDILIAHRLPQKQSFGQARASKSANKHPTIIAPSVSRYERNQIYASRFNAKNIEEFPVDGMDKLYINENLTQRRKQLFWLTKQKAKDMDYSYIWTYNGQIYEREDKNSDRLHIKHESDLDDM